MHFGISDDNPEDVVEFVSNTACKCTDGLHFLELAELFLKLLLEGNIMEHSQNK
jgi:hypothetical protein